MTWVGNFWRWSPPWPLVSHPYLPRLACRRCHHIWGTPSRTAIVLALSLTVLWWSGEHQKAGTLNGRAWLFLALSGLATAVSWVAYFKALSIGSATPVTAIDKASLVVTMILAILFLGERLSWRGGIGVMLIVAGSILASWGPSSDARTSTRRRVTAVLKKVFGVTALRPGQQAVIDAVLAGKHTLALMPTGAGKSLCYQVPAMLKPGRTVVVSPLIALMRDQFEKMSALGITAVQVNSAVSADEARRARAKIGRRTVEFVFTTPEQLTSPALRAMLSRAVVDLLVIDEAHCISQWGHDFRPAYVEALATIRELGTPTILALTATAPPEVIDDITKQLKVGPLHIVNTGAHRPNLSYSVHPVSSDAEKQRELLATVRRIDGAAIVYAATVRHVDELAALFRQEGVRAVSYHGRMRASERADAQDAFMTGGTPLIVATNAFGMGIDRPDVRAVVHYDLPASLDVYSQESGRAGRDGRSRRMHPAVPTRRSAPPDILHGGPIPDPHGLHDVRCGIALGVESGADARADA